MSRASFGLLMFPVPGLAAAMGQMVESAGWDAVHFADTQNLAADVYVSLAQAAAATERITLATGVTNPVTRHAVVTATAIASIQLASGGRAVLGIGRGDSSLGVLGRPPAKVADFERYVVGVHDLLQGRPTEIDGHITTNEWIATSQQPPVPLDVAATGPRVTTIAARHAERVTFAVGADVERLRQAVDLARRERAAAGHDPDTLRVGAYVNVAAHPDAAVAREIVRGGTATFAHFSGMSAAPTRAEGADASVYASIGDQYDVREHASGSAGHAQTMPQEFVDRFAVAGPAEECVRRLSELVDVGLDHLVLVPGSRDAERAELLASLDRLAHEVLPKLR